MTRLGTVWQSQDLFPTDPDIIPLSTDNSSTYTFTRGSYAIACIRRENICYIHVWPEMFFRLTYSADSLRRLHPGTIFACLLLFFISIAQLLEFFERSDFYYTDTKSHTADYVTAQDQISTLYPTPAPTQGGGSTVDSGEGTASSSSVSRVQNSNGSRSEIVSEQLLYLTIVTFCTMAFVGGLILALKGLRRFTDRLNGNESEDNNRVLRLMNALNFQVAHSRMHGDFRRTEMEMAFQRLLGDMESGSSEIENRGLQPHQIARLPRHVYAGERDNSVPQRAATAPSTSTCGQLGISSEESLSLERELKSDDIPTVHASTGSLNGPTTYCKPEPQLDGKAGTVSSCPISTDAPDPNGRTCAVCLEPFEVGEDLRTVACFHRFHCRCIDRWLVQDSTCPICKMHALGEDD